MGVERRRVLLTLFGVTGFDSLLDRAPPIRIVAIPRDGGRQAVPKSGVTRRPAELAVNLGRIDRIAEIVARAVVDVFIPIRRFVHQGEDELDDRFVVLFAVGADHVVAARLAMIEYGPYGGVMVIHMDPVADVGTRAIEFRFPTAEDIGDLAGDEFFDVLVRPVIV